MQHVVLIVHVHNTWKKEYAEIEQKIYDMTIETYRYHPLRSDPLIPPNEYSSNVLLKFHVVTYLWRMKDPKVPQTNFAHKDFLNSFHNFTSQLV